MNAKKTSNKRTFVLATAALALVIGLYFAKIIFGGNVYSNDGQEDIYFPIPSSVTTVDEISELLDSNVNVTSMMGFRLAAKIVSLKDHIYPGLYHLKNGMSSKDMVLLFRSGRRETVGLTIKFARHYEDVLKLVSEKIEAPYEDLYALCNDRAFMDSLGFNKANLVCLFVPDTYEFYWNTSARTFLLRMKKEYDAFWTDARRAKARAMRLSPHQVTTLASIVNQETTVNSEKPKIAGVYFNRLRSNETSGKLQADPTIKFALNDFEIKRVRKGHIERAKKSPYSTYEKKGLPPGPICVPSKTDIDAVLNYTHHNYFYFCAQPNYSGKSNFSASFEQHRRFATEYQKWLTKEGY